MDLSRTVSDIKDFGRKSQIFPTPHVLYAPIGVLIEFVTAIGFK